MRQQAMTGASGGARMTMVLALMCVLAASGCKSTSHDALTSTHRDNPVVDEFSASAARTPTPQTLYAMGRLLAARGRDAQACFVFERIIERNPEFVPAYIDLAECRLRNHSIELAIDTLERGLVVAPDNAILHNDLGMCHLLQEDYEQALEHFNHAVELDAQNRRYRGNQALMLGMLGRYDESIAVYRKIVPPAHVHHNLAVICESRNDMARAAIEREQARTLGYYP